MSDEAAIESKLECTVRQEDGTEGCGSSDAMALYSDHKYCFSCKRRESLGEMPTASKTTTAPRTFEPVMITSLELRKRNLRRSTLQKYRYGGATNKAGVFCQVTDIVDQDGHVVAQKWRDAEKNFWITGSMPKVPTFWGQNLFQPSKKVKLVVTEGELDAMSVSQVFDNRYAVVSLPGGATSAEKVFKAQLKWLEGWKEVVLCFDQDDAGLKAQKDAMRVLPPGSCKVVALPRKDASDMLQNGEAEELKRAIFDAKLYRPETIISGDAIYSALTKETNFDTIPFFHSGVQEKLLGTRAGEITLFGAGTGVGKSLVVKEVLANCIMQGHRVGTIFLEEAVKRSVQGLLTPFVNFPIHLRMLEGGMSEAERAKMEKAFNDYIRPNVEMVDTHIVSPEDLLRHVRYLVVSLGCKVIAIDHITMLANLAPSGGERELLDNTMNKLAALFKDLGAQLVLVSHLKRPLGTPHEEGGQVRQGDFRGSTQICALSHNVIGVERNQQHPTNRDFTHLRVLKCRETGRTGSAGWVFYNADTGRLEECEEPAGGLTGVATPEPSFPEETF